MCDRRVLRRRSVIGQPAPTPLRSGFRTTPLLSRPTSPSHLFVHALTSPLLGDLAAACDPQQRKQREQPQRCCLQGRSPLTTAITDTITVGKCTAGFGVSTDFFLTVFAVVLAGVVFYVGVHDDGFRRSAVGVVAFGLDLIPVWIFGRRRGSAVALAFFADVAFWANDIDTGITHAFSVFAIATAIALDASTGMLGGRNALSIFAKLAIRASDGFTAAWCDALSVFARVAFGASDVGACIDALAFFAVLGALTFYIFTGIGDTLTISAALTCGAAKLITVFGAFVFALAFDADLIGLAGDVGASVEALAIFAILIVAALDTRARIFATDTVLAVIPSRTFCRAFLVADALDADIALGGGCVVVHHTVAIVVFVVADFGLRLLSVASAPLTVATGLDA